MCQGYVVAIYLSHKWPLCIVSHYNHVYQLCAAYGTMCFTVGMRLLCRNNWLLKELRIILE